MIFARTAAHVRDLWGNRWLLPLLPAAYALVMLGIGDLRPEHVGAGLVVMILGFATASTKRFLVAAFPGILIALGYDVLRYVRPIFVVPDRVVGCGIRNVELALFGMGGKTTLADFFATHHTPAFDLYFALPYGLFYSVAVIYACYLFWTDFPRMQRYLWALAVAHVIAFTTWLALPAAPPWYIQAHGCDIYTSVAPSAAGLLRVDQDLGIHYFRDFYSRGPTVFGALPSMHCAFPMIGLLTAWPVATRLTRVLHVVYALSMIAGSVYLDHHWLIDGLAGWLCAAIAVLVVGAVLKQVRASAGAAAASPAPTGALP
jgi:hypothetical protein